jgi:hypothetical protein
MRDQSELKELEGTQLADRTDNPTHTVKRNKMNTHAQAPDAARCSLKINTIRNIQGLIFSGSHGGEYGDGCFLGFCAQ